MYIPAAFALTDPQELHRILREHPLGTLVTHGPQGLDADHIPFEFDPDAGPLGTLRAHVARANPVWQQVAAGSPVLVVFRGEQAYVSPNWYPSKHEAHRQVPTWNYEVVHAHGTFTAHDDERYLRGVVARLTRHHEVTEPKPWKMSDAPADYLAQMMGQIVGIEIAVTSLVGKSKMSQNKEARDRQGVAEAYEARGRAGLAGQVRKAL
ncbi:MAG: FMN-binding negative transcriptional regulator [Ramlibacter sp.]|uniref:FMN-binding negative transcriptional regulator n=1 Tax=Ramlibacter sp. TaxID=1917967 RepID=UPI0026060162|nr:FMN-binding negative transcriptional regulator [Ramlibacter sp.]MDH4377441.1 FMN-binding negative transcriptional regulator [Ramlibacter sp.]